jgi:hypothetical protein
VIRGRWGVQGFYLATCETTHLTFRRTPTEEFLERNPLARCGLCQERLEKMPTSLDGSSQGTSG